ncbi:hypothetical protein SV7mr_14610 [Stieleria bergensis]|uniref:Uncharacterized protein n=1 Tax=Stieleria bergensis TaxID=2528025 RepID=A0A517SS72_9BACT|nr:hypothetical protein SV7mr_14610 [Planctomycetes bacterium SV_7m_r]
MRAVLRPVALERTETEVPWLSPTGGDRQGIFGFPAIGRRPDKPDDKGRIDCLFIRETRIRRKTKRFQASGVARNEYYC